MVLLLALTRLLHLTTRSLFNKAKYVSPTSSQDSSASEPLKNGVLYCLGTSLNILRNFFKDRIWAEHWVSVLSALQLLNAFTDYFNLHSADMVNHGLTRSCVCVCVCSYLCFKM